MSTKHRGKKSSVYRGQERRQHKRLAYVTPVQAIWRIKNGQQVFNEETVTLVSHDYSNGRLGFIHTEPISVGDQLRVTFRTPDGTTMESIVEIVHCSLILRGRVHRCELGLKQNRSGRCIRREFE